MFIPIRSIQASQAGRSVDVKKPRPLKSVVGVPIQCHHSSKRLLYTSIGDTCKDTIGGTQWENL